jgi:hypothetical protein
LIYYIGFLRPRLSANRIVPWLLHLGSNLPATKLRLQAIERLEEKYLPTAELPTARDFLDEKNYGTSLVKIPSGRYMASYFEQR